MCTYFLMPTRNYCNGVNKGWDFWGDRGCGGITTYATYFFVEMCEQPVMRGKCSSFSVNLSVIHRITNIHTTAWFIEVYSCMKGNKCAHNH